MCLGVPGKVVEVDASDLLRAGRVDFGGVIKDVSLVYVPEATAGDYVIVHVGFAIARVDEEEALRTRQLLDELAAMEAREASDEEAPG